MPPLSRSLHVVAMGATLLLGVLWVRTLAEARVELSRAELLAREHGPTAAREPLSRAVRWVSPFNLYADRALAKLVALARTQERAGERRAALRSYRAARGSLRASAGLVQLRAGVLEECDERIHALSAELAPQALWSAGAGQPPPALDGGRPWARLLALVGFFGWCAAGFRLAMRGGALVDRGALRRHASLLALLAAGFACFGLGLWLA